MNENLPYKDRSVGLTVFGILTMLGGCMAALMILMMVMGGAQAARGNAPAQPAWAIATAGGFYGTVALVLIWLGIGSIMARRWARALLLIASWAWLVIGVLSMVGVGFIMPKIFATITVPATGGAPAQPMPQGAIIGAMIVAMIMVGFFYVLVPLVWVLFYGGKNVKATCEARHPAPCWTDACPLPLLALAMLAMISGIFCLLMQVMGFPHVIPVFGKFVTGFPAAAIFAAVGVIYIIAGWLLYKVKVAGWWINLIVVLAWAASAIVTFSHTDMTEMFKLMGYPDQMLAQMQMMKWMDSNFMIMASLCGLVPWLAYILFVRKFFRPRAVEGAGGGGADIPGSV